MADTDEARPDGGSQRHRSAPAPASRVRRFEPTGEVIRRYDPVVRSVDSVPLAVEGIAEQRWTSPSDPNMV